MKAGRQRGLASLGEGTRHSQGAPGKASGERTPQAY